MDKTTDAKMCEVRQSILQVHTYVYSCTYVSASTIRNELATELHKRYDDSVWSSYTMVVFKRILHKQYHSTMSGSWCVTGSNISTYLGTNIPVHIV